MRRTHERLLEECSQCWPDDRRIERVDAFTKEDESGSAAGGRRSYKRPEVPRRTGLAQSRPALVLVELDFPRGKAQSDELKRQNEELAEKFGVQGFPTLVLLDPQGKEAARNVGYLQGGPEAFIQWVEAAGNR